VIQLSDRVFRFSVSCKQVGFFIYHLKHFSCINFVVFFHLWNDEGLDWLKGLKDFQAKEIEEWTTISYKKPTYAEITRKNTFTGANSIPLPRKKDWRPRIVLDHDQTKAPRGRISAFDRLGNQQRPCLSVFKCLGASRPPADDLIPRKSVFDHLHFELDHARSAKNKDRAQDSLHSEGTVNSSSVNKGEFEIQNDLIPQKKEGRFIYVSSLVILRLCAAAHELHKAPAMVLAIGPSQSQASHPRQQQRIAVKGKSRYMKNILTPRVGLRELYQLDPYHLRYSNPLLNLRDSYTLLLKRHNKARHLVPALI
jgi:hypothetical protein